MEEISKKWFCVPKGVGGQAYECDGHRDLALITHIHSNYYLDSEVLMNTYQEEVGRKDFFLPCLLCNQLNMIMLL